MLAPDLLPHPPHTYRVGKVGLNLFLGPGCFLWQLSDCILLAGVRIHE